MQNPAQTFKEEARGRWVYFLKDIIDRNQC